MTGSRRIATPLVWGACGFVVAAGVSLVAGPPLPEIHDEFSRLLGADTLRAGRVANPPPALPAHFETFHVLTSPAYASKYLPGPFLPLALGALLGSPVFGIWLTMGALTGALFWQLRGWLGPRWSGVGTFLLLAWMGVGRWSHSYLDAPFAALGGCLLLGAAQRASRHPWRRLVLPAAAGLALLAASRPWEGLFLAGGGLLIAALDRPRTSLRRRLATLDGRSAVAAAALLASTLVALLAYNREVTGAPLLLPYQVYDHQYARVPLFPWQPLREVDSPASSEMATFHQTWEIEAYHRQRSLAGWVQVAGEKARGALLTFVGPWLLPFWVAAPWALRRTRPRAAAIALLVVLSSQLLIVPINPRYLAPAVGLFVYLTTAILRTIVVPASRRRIVLRHGARLALGLLVLAAPFRLLGERQGGFPLHRHDLQRELRSRAGQDLVLVEYGPAHSPLSEWVYNEADLDRTEVLWARSLGAAADCRLVALERDRRAWLLRVEEALSGPRLAPFPASRCSPPAVLERDPATGQVSRASSQRRTQAAPTR